MWAICRRALSGKVHKADESDERPDSNKSVKSESNEPNDFFALSPPGQLSVAGRWPGESIDPERICSVLQFKALAVYR